MDGRRYADEPEPQWYGDRDWRTPAADAAAPEDEPRATTRPRRASDPLTDPTGYSDHWNAPRIKAPESAEVPAQSEVRSRRGYEYDAVTGRAMEALPVVKPTSAVPDPEPELPGADRTAAYPLTGDIPRFRTEALDRAALRRPPADPAAAAKPPAELPVDAPADPARTFSPPSADPLYGPPAMDPPYAPDPAYVPGGDPAYAPGGERVYTTRRPILAVPIGLVVLLLEFPALRLLLDGFTGGTDAAGHLVSGLALTLSLPLTGMGLYTLFTTGRAADHRTWWRPPMAHLPLGLILLIAAAIAAR